MSEVQAKLRAELIKINNRQAILLDANASPIWVSFAFIERETEEVILPESLLDDWGREISSLKLYQWVRDNGQQFPRAEIFGHRPSGNPVQRFLREIDLTAKYPCFIIKSSKETLGVMIQADLILVRDDTIYQAKKVDPPAHIPYPLSHIAADWWLVPGSELVEIKDLLSQSLKFYT